jgi:hypothetical protein
MQGPPPRSTEDQAAELVDFIDLHGYVLTYSAALYLCRLLPAWKTEAPVKLRLSLESIGIDLSTDEILDALERISGGNETLSAEAEADWEILITRADRQPLVHRLRGAFFEASRAFSAQVGEAISREKPFPWGLIRPTTAGVTVSLDVRTSSSSARLRCLTHPLPVRVLVEHRQYVAEALRRTFEDRHHGWLDGAAALTAGASTAELGFANMRRTSTSGPEVESRVFAAIEHHAGSSPLPEQWLTAVSSGSLKLYTTRDTGRTLVDDGGLRALFARYGHFVESNPGLSFQELCAGRLA